MAAPKRATHEVVHPRLYLSVGGKLQRAEVGLQLVCTDAQAKSYGKKVRKLGGKKMVDLTEKESKKSDKTGKDDFKK